jgi:hypothetical protein
VERGNFEDLDVGGRIVFTLSNPIFLPPAYSPALIYFGQENHNVGIRHYDFPVPDAFPHVVRTLAYR